MHFPLSHGFFLFTFCASSGLCLSPGNGEDDQVPGELDFYFRHLTGISFLSKWTPLFSSLPSVENDSRHLIPFVCRALLFHFFKISLFSFYHCISQLMVWKRIGIFKMGKPAHYYPAYKSPVSHAHFSCAFITILVIIDTILNFFSLKIIALNFCHLILFQWTVIHSPPFF